nr:MAG TPA: hypothetical protein [Caudoviricetes sp.]
MYTSVSSSSYSQSYFARKISISVFKNSFSDILCFPSFFYEQKSFCIAAPSCDYSIALFTVCVNWQSLQRLYCLFVQT